MLLICLLPTLGWITAQSSQAHAIRLSGPMPAFGQVLDFRISPDNRNVVYVADQESDLGRARLADIFLTSSRYEWSFWEMAWRMETWPV